MVWNMERQIVAIIVMGAFLIPCMSIINAIDVSEVPVGRQDVPEFLAYVEKNIMDKRVEILGTSDQDAIIIEGIRKGSNNFEKTTDPNAIMQKPLDQSIVLIDGVWLSGQSDNDAENILEKTLFSGAPLLIVGNASNQFERISLPKGISYAYMPGADILGLIYYDNNETIKIKSIVDRSETQSVRDYWMTNHVTELYVWGAHHLESDVPLTDKETIVVTPNSVWGNYYEWPAASVSLNAPPYGRAN